MVSPTRPDTAGTVPPDHREPLVTRHHPHAVLARGAGEEAGGAIATRATPMGTGPVFLRVESGRLVSPYGGVLHPDDETMVKQLLASADEGAHTPVRVRWLHSTGEQRDIELAVL